MGKHPIDVEALRDDRESWRGERKRSTSTARRTPRKRGLERALLLENSADRLGLTPFERDEETVEVRVIRGGYDEASLFFKNGEETRLVSFRSSLRVRDDGVSPFLRFLDGSRREGGAACRLPSLEKAGAWRGGGEIGLVIVALLRDITGY